MPNWFYYWGNAAIIKGLNTSPGIPLATVNKYPLYPAGFVMATTPTPITIPYIATKELLSIYLVAVEQQVPIYQQHLLKKKAQVKSCLMEG